MLRVALALVLVGLLSACRHPRSKTHAKEQAPSSALVLPEVTLLRDGDLIFQESTSAQSEMVATLTNSRWTHMGIVFVRPKGAFVLEAASPVRETSLRKWIAHGRGQRYVVKRLRDADAKLAPSTIEKMKALAAAWRGRPYDTRFRWDDGAFYCSELAFKLFDRAAGIQIGTLQRATDMNLDAPSVRRAISKRFAGAQLDPNETVITPDAMYNDEALVTVEL